MFLSTLLRSTPLRDSDLLAVLPLRQAEQLPPGQAVAYDPPAEREEVRRTLTTRRRSGHAAASRSPVELQVERQHRVVAPDGVDEVGRAVVDLDGHHSVPVLAGETSGKD